MKRPFRRLRSVGALLALVGGSLVLVGAIATTAGAQTGGYIKICKTFSAPPISVDTSASFGFTVTQDGTSPPVVVDTVSVTAGYCSVPLPVDPANTYTITEASEPWYQVTGITENPGQDYIISSSDSGQDADVSVAAGNDSEVYFTNALITGYAKICKNPAAGSGLTGDYGFNLSGQDGYSSTLTVTAGYCSLPIEVPAGDLTVTEAGTNLYVTGITAYENDDSTTTPIFDTTISGNPDLTTGTATVIVTPNTNESQVSVVTYTDDVVDFEVCKAFDDGDYSTQPNGTDTSYTFTETATGPAGPNTPPSGSFTLVPGVAGEQCSFPTAYRPGTVVTVTELPTPGTKVESIDAYGAESVVTGYPDLADGIEQVIIGTPVTSSGSPGDEAVVWYTDELADPSTLEICKVATPDTGTYTFTVAGPQYVSDSSGAIAPGSITVTVTLPNGPCATITGLPYNSTQLVTEAATPTLMATGITSNFTDVTVYEGGVATPTMEPVLTNLMLGSGGTTSSVDVTMSEGPSDTIVTWTNAVAATAGAAAVAGNDAGPAAVAGSDANSSAGLSSPVNGPLLRDEVGLARVNAAIKSIEKALHLLKGAAHRAALKRLAALKLERRLLKARMLGLK